MWTPSVRVQQRMIGLHCIASCCSVRPRCKRYIRSSFSKVSRVVPFLTSNRCSRAKQNNNPKTTKDHNQRQQQQQQPPDLQQQQQQQQQQHRPDTSGVTPSLHHQLPPSLPPPLSHLTLSLTLTLTPSLRHLHDRGQEEVGVGRAHPHGEDLHQLPHRRQRGPPVHRPEPGRDGLDYLQVLPCSA